MLQIQLRLPEDVAIIVLRAVLCVSSFTTCQHCPQACINVTAAYAQLVPGMQRLACTAVAPEVQNRKAAKFRCKAEHLCSLQVMVQSLTRLRSLSLTLVTHNNSNNRRRLHRTLPQLFKCMTHLHLTLLRLAVPTLCGAAAEAFASMVHRLSQLRRLSLHTTETPDATLPDLRRGFAKSTTTSGATDVDISMHIGCADICTACNEVAALVRACPGVTKLVLTLTGAEIAIVPMSRGRRIQNLGLHATQLDRGSHSLLPGAIGSRSLLHSLSLMGDSMPSLAARLERVLDYKPHLSRLQLRTAMQNEAAMHDHVRLFKRLSQLRSLAFGDSGAIETAVTADVVNNLTHLRCLSQLDLSHSRIPRGLVGNVFEVVQGLPSLTDVAIRDVRATQLSRSFCRPDTDFGFGLAGPASGGRPSLALLTSLQALDLSQMQAPLLPRAAPGAVASRLQKPGRDVLRAACHLHNLTSLCLCGMYLSGLMPDLLATRLMTRLARLDLRRTCMLTDDVAALSAGLHQGTRLTTLLLTGNLYGRQRLQSLLEALACMVPARVDVGHAKVSSGTPVACRPYSASLAGIGAPKPGSAKPPSVEPPASPPPMAADTLPGGPPASVPISSIGSAAAAAPCAPLAAASCACSCAGDASRRAAYAPEAVAAKRRRTIPSLQYARHGKQVRSLRSPACAVGVAHPCICTTAHCEQLPAGLRELPVRITGPLPLSPDLTMQ